MRAHRLRRRIPGLVPLLWSAALLAICMSGTAAAAPTHQSSLGGTWAGRYSGAYSGTFTLRWKQSGSVLRGSIALSFPKGKYPITGSVRGHTIKFGAVGAGATYTGSVSASGKSMSGAYKTARGGGKWSAHKVS
jgi:hypothetical protein